MIVTETRVPLCTLDEIAPGLGRSFDVCGRLVAVYRSRDGQLFAVDGVCPHKGGLLADGMLIGEQVVCPLHAFRYHGTTGECDQPGACAIQAYPVELHEGNIYVTVPY